MECFFVPQVDFLFNAVYLLSFICAAVIDPARLQSACKPFGLPWALPIICMAINVDW